MFFLPYSFWYTFALKKLNGCSCQLLYDTCTYVICVYRHWSCKIDSLQLSLSDTCGRLEVYNRFTVSSIKTDNYKTTEILLKVALNFDNL